MRVAEQNYHSGIQNGDEHVITADQKTHSFLHENLSRKFSFLCALIETDNFNNKSFFPTKLLQTILDNSKKIRCFEKVEKVVADKIINDY